jgi:hypothetical protein
VASVSSSLLLVVHRNCGSGYKTLSLTYFLQSTRRLNGEFLALNLIRQSVWLAYQLICTKGADSSYRDSASWLGSVMSRKRRDTAHASFSTLNPFVSPLGSLSRTVCPDWMVVALNEFRLLGVVSQSGVSMGLHRPNDFGFNCGVAQEKCFQFSGESKPGRLQFHLLPPTFPRLSSQILHSLVYGDE